MQVEELRIIRKGAHTRFKFFYDFGSFLLSYKFKKHLQDTNKILLKIRGS